jgi:molybdopterin synthase catalytic subunit
MSDVRIQREDFDPGAEIAALGNSHGETGAIASFIGLVRGDGGLSAMTLDHYPGFAEAEIAAHVAEAKRRWPLLGVRIVHRTGRLKVGERIVFCAAASSHRKAAFEAAEFLMDYLKTRAPFWKLEEREGGGAAWVEARNEDDEAVKRWQKV